MSCSFSFLSFFFVYFILMSKMYVVKEDMLSFLQDCVLPGNIKECFIAYFIFLESLYGRRYTI